MMDQLQNSILKLITLIASRACKVIDSNSFFTKVLNRETSSTSFCRQSWVLFVGMPSILFLGHSLLAQGIQGKVVDSSYVPIPNVNVLLLDPLNSKFIAGSLTDMEGDFEIINIKNGSYLLQLSYVGYQNLVMEVSVKNTIALGAIIMQETRRELDEVVITATKPVFEQKIDRLIVNVKNSATSVGGTALEVLERTPGVAVDRSSSVVSLNGKNGVLVFVDGKPSRIPVNALIPFLEGMNAQNIDRIELLSNPPAKYEAAGNAGIIDIRLVKNENNGINGSSSVTLGYGTNDKQGLTANLNARQEKWSFHSDLSFMRDHSAETWTSYVENDTENQNVTLNTISERDPTITNVNGSIGLDYQVNEKFIISSIISGYYNNWDMVADNRSLKENDGTLEQLVTTKNVETNEWYNISNSINMEYKPSDKSQWDLEVDYLYFKNDNPTTYLNKFFDGSSQLDSIQNVQATKRTPIKVWVGRLDYQNKLHENLSIEAGVSGTFSNFRNDVDIQEEVNQSFIRNEALSEFSTLKEQILGAYSSLHYTIDESNTLMLGLRYEYANVRLNSVTEGPLLDVSYGNLFPTLFYSRTFSENSKLFFSYGRRITRPAYSDLAPFVIFLDPNTYFFGNTALQPALSDNVNVNYQLKKTIISLQYGHENEAIANYQPVIIENNQLVYTSVNLDYSDTYSLSVSQRYSPFTWFEGNLNILGALRKIKTADNRQFQQGYFQINGNQTFKLSNSFLIEISGYYQSKSIWGISYVKAYGNITGGLQYKFMNGSKLNFTITNVFGFEYGKFIDPTLNANYYTSILYSYEPRIVKLTYSITFGNEKLKNERNRAKGVEEVKARVN